MDDCEDCGQPTDHTDTWTGIYLCPACQEEREIHRAENAEEQALADYHGGDGPQTLDERHEQAWRQKRYGR